MNSRNNIRQRFFWIADRLKGSRVKSHYKDVKYILTHYKEDLSKDKRDRYLKEILLHAVETTPFYKDTPGETISDFPIIDKTIVRENFDDFITDNPDFKHVATVVTSGSTGTPFAMEIDRRKKERNSSDTIFFGELAGFTIGQRLYYFKIWNKFNQKTRLSAMLQNIVPCDVRDQGEGSIESIIEDLKRDRSEKSLLAYASVYDALCAHLVKTDSGPVLCNLKAVIAMSESFSMATQELIKKYFGVDSVSRYSNVENGIIGQQLAGGNGEFLINEASYYVEILEQDSDIPVQEGTPGRIVITDLFNYRMPLIRYDTGDIGKIEYRDLLGSKRPVLTSIEGRRMDLLYDTKGTLVSSYVITNNMWKYMEINQYQFIQTSAHEYLFKLNTDKPFDREKELIKEFTTYFGEDSSISVEYVNEIPLLNSGKRKKVMNSWEKS